MKMTKVKEMMVSVSDYTTVSEDANLFEAIMALEASQEKNDPARYPHRAILALDSDGNVVGKVNMFSILGALEPKYDQIGDPGGVSWASVNPDFLKSMVKKYSLWDKPLEDICAKASGKKVKNFMFKPSEGECIDQDATLNEAIHLLILGNKLSLLVTEDDKIIGILRFVDLFDHVCELIKACKLTYRNV